MNISRNYPIRVLTVGAIVLLLVSLGLYWGRFVCKVALGYAIPYANRRVRVEPCGLVPSSLEAQGESAIPSRIAADADLRRVVGLGMVDYFDSHLAGGGNSGVFQYQQGAETLCTYFDAGIGRIVQCKIYQEEQDDQDKSGLWVKEPLFFVGPDGVSVVDSDKLGKFVDPLAEFETASAMLIFDRRAGRLFRADLDARRTLEAPAEAMEKIGSILAVERIQIKPNLLNMNWTPPLRPASEDERQSKADDLMFGNVLPMVRLSKTPGEYVLALDDSGRIYRLDRKTLAFAGLAGHLPAAPEYSLSRDEIARPCDLSAYHVEAVAFEPNSLHQGIFVATLSRDGTGAALAVFDADGEMIRLDVTMASSVRRRAMQEDYGDLPDSDIIAQARTGRTALEVAWGPMLTGARYVLENVQPPVFSMISYLVGPSLTAEAGHRSLFILPHSFAGALGRKHREHRIQRLALLMLVISPSLILAGLLAVAVKTDARNMGLSDRATKYWTAGTIAFGLPAYLTWRLTRPGETLVTCINCGRGRRPDMERCHRCGSPWEVPELVVPNWRVFDDHAAEADAAAKVVRAAVDDNRAKVADETAAGEEADAQQDNVEF